MGDSITSTVFGAVTDWSQPMLTFYDDGSGERTELSGATLGNWAAKTANFFVDELGLAPGDDVLVDLPEHWQTVAMLLGAWWSGAHIIVPTSTGADDDAHVAIVSRDRLDGHTAPDELVVASLDPFALGLRDLPPGVLDFATSVRVHGDQFRPSPVSGPALADLTSDDVVAQSRAAAAAAGITASSRVLQTRTWHTTDTIVENLLAPLVTGASLVAVVHADVDAIAARATAERATVTLS